VSVCGGSRAESAPQRPVVEPAFGRGDLGDDQIVPYADSAPLSAKLVQNGTLKTYQGFPHGMPTTEAETINADLLAFLQS
jgi:hypothetical protein